MNIDDNSATLQKPLAKNEVFCMLGIIKISIIDNIAFVKKIAEKYTKFLEVMGMTAIAANNKAAIVLSQEDELHLKNIAHLHSCQSVRDRANILLCLGKMRYSDAVKASGKTNGHVSRIKREWAENELRGSARIEKICARNSGRRKNDETLQSRIHNVISFNRRLNPDTPRHARAGAIVEMAKSEGMDFSVRTVTRYLQEYEQKQFANV